MSEPSGMNEEELDRELQQETMETLRHELDELKKNFDSYRKERKANEEASKHERSLLRQRNDITK